jgi:ribonuclease P protein component
MNVRFTFPKKERLCYKKDIDRVFSEGKSFALGPLKVFYLVPDIQEEWPARVLIAIPRKKFKRAVDRNRLRRMIREAYRMNKHKLNETGRHLHIALVYTGNTTAIPFAELRDKLVVCLDKLVRLAVSDSRPA